MKHGKALLHIHSQTPRPAEKLREFVEELGIKVLNVAGPSTSPQGGIEEFVRRVFSEALMDRQPDPVSLALAFCREFYDALCAALSDPLVVRDRVEAIRSHAPTFPETLFCKGCVLPVLDTVATRFLGEHLTLDALKVKASLRCEGITSLPKIYTPGVGQSGYGGVSWGMNYQQVSKSGKVAAEGEKGKLPSPDFGVVHIGPPSIAILGETKFDEKKQDISAKSLVSDLQYYMGLPLDRARGWHYEFGIGIAYALGGSSDRKAELQLDHWEKSRFVVIRFTAS